MGFDLAAGGDHQEPLLLKSLDSALELQFRIERAQVMEFHPIPVQELLGFLRLHQTLEDFRPFAVELLHFAGDTLADQLAQGDSDGREIPLAGHGGGAGPGIENAPCMKQLSPAGWPKSAISTVYPEPLSVDNQAAFPGAGSRHRMSLPTGLPHAVRATAPSDSEAVRELEPWMNAPAPPISLLSRVSCRSAAIQP